MGRHRLVPLVEEWATQVHPDQVRQAADHYETCLNGGFSENRALARATAFLMQEATVPPEKAEQALRAAVEKRRAARNAYIPDGRSRKRK